MRALSLWQGAGGRSTFVDGFEEVHKAHPLCKLPLLGQRVPAHAAPALAPAASAVPTPNVPPLLYPFLLLRALVLLRLIVHVPTPLPCLLRLDERIHALLHRVSSLHRLPRSRIATLDKRLPLPDPWPVQHMNLLRRPHPRPTVDYLGRGQQGRPVDGPSRRHQLATQAKGLSFCPRIFPRDRGRGGEARPRSLFALEVIPDRHAARPSTERAARGNNENPCSQHFSNDRAYFNIG